jgi:WXG100 family type VII secretion target
VLVNVKMLDEAGSELDAIADDIEQQLSDLREFLLALAETWTGEAASDYQIARQRWDATATEMNQMLRQIASELRLTADHYRSTVHAVGAKWP